MIHQTKSCGLIVLGFLSLYGCAGTNQSNDRGPTNPPTVSGTGTGSGSGSASSPTTANGSTPATGTGAATGAGSSPGTGGTVAGGGSGSPSGTGSPLTTASLSPAPGTVFQGHATHFDGLGTPAGGCGIPQDSGILETQNFVALNVQNTPGNYTSFLKRPLVGADTASMGAWNNGLNCGRWVKVTIGNFCTGGDNSGNPGAGGFCVGGSWSADQYSGATLNMLVADSCQDNNEWCRDDAFHLDLSTASLAQFSNGSGQVLPNMLPNAWNNRQISWQYTAAPNYQGDIKIWFILNAKAAWTAIAINNLQNGIHGVDVLINGQWTKASMNSDNGQSYILPTSSSTSSYTIRVYDANDQLIQNGRTYTFSLPSACASGCPAFTPASYTAG